MVQLSSQLELFKNNIEEDLVNAIIYLRKEIRSCEKRIYKIEKTNIITKQRVSYDVALNPDGTINFTVESVRRKYIKIDELEKKAIYHTYKACYAYRADLENVYEHINLNMRLVCDSGNS